MNILGFIILFVVVLALWLGAVYFGQPFFDTWSKDGQIGNSFESINSLLSGLALAGVISTIYLQRWELVLQRDELQLQRKEMAAMREELAVQVTARNALAKEVEATREELAAQVTAQETIAVATIGQIRISAGLTQVEALRMSAETLPSRAQENIVDLNKIARDMEKLADELEERH